MSAVWTKLDVSPITCVLEAAFGASLTDDPSTWVWTDISSRMKGSAKLTRGKADTSAQTQPSRCSLTLNNSDSALTPRHPLSQWYLLWALGTPMRLKVTNVRTGVSFIRCQGGVTSINPRWPAGNSGYAVVDVEFAGVLYRLGQGKDIRSAMYRGIAADKPTQYWSMEDSKGATSFADYAGGDPLYFQGSPLPSLSTGGPSIASAPVMTTAAGTTAFGLVRMKGTTTAWTVEWYMNLGGPGVGAANPIWEWRTGGTLRQWRFTNFVFAGMDTVGMEAWDPSQTSNSGGVLGGPAGTYNVNFTIDGVNEAYGTDLYMSVSARQNGANIDIEYRGSSADGRSFFRTGGTLAGYTIGSIYQVSMPAQVPNTPAGWVLGHLSVFNHSLDTSWGTANFPHALLLNANSGDLADARVAKMAGLAQVAYRARTPGSVVSPSSVLGPTAIASPLALMREGEAADLGVLTDGLNSGVDYLARAARYNLPVGMALNGSSAQVKLPFEPVENDQNFRNTEVVSRVNGSSATAMGSNTATVGVYPDQPSLNLATDADLNNQAYFRLNLNMVPEMRTPQLRINLQDRPELIQPWLDNCDIGTRYTAINLVTQFTPATLDQIILQYTETIDASTWTVDIVGAPFAPWRVFTVGDAVLGRTDTSGSKLQNLVSATATSWSVLTTDGPLWTTTATFPGDFPFDVDCEGEQVRVTAITGTSSPQTFTVTRSINGIVKQHAANALLGLWHPAVVAL